VPFFIPHLRGAAAAAIFGDGQISGPDQMSALGAVAAHKQFA